MKYEPNYRGTSALLRSRDIQDHVVARTEVGAAAARARSPVETGAYRDSITVERDWAGARRAATLTATVPYAQFLEQRYHVISSVVDVIEHGG